MKHPIGAVIGTVDSKYVLGWNGAPSKSKHKKCSREGYPSGQGMEFCPSVHAEVRAITYAAKKGIKLEGSTIYLSEWFPCSNCAKAITESGIRRLVTPDEVYSNAKSYELAPNLKNQPYNFELAEKILRESGIEIIIDSSLKE